MNISRTLTPALLAAALLLPAGLPHVRSEFQAPMSASAEPRVLRGQQQLADGNPDAVKRAEALGDMPISPANNTPTSTQIQVSLAGAVSTAWLPGVGDVATRARTKVVEPHAKLQAKARAVLNKYGCSSSGIRINDKRLGKHANGMADWYNNVVLLRSSMPASRVTYVSAHECMHMRQYRAYKGNVNQLAAAMNKIYGGKGFLGLERNADCMTRAVGIKVTNNAYASSCIGAKKAAALKLLSGKRA